MTQEQRVKALEDELEQLKEANDALYRQHANEKAQMQIAIEHERLQATELQQANDAYRDENEQWRVAYEQLETSKRQGDETWESEKRALEDKVALLEESVKSYSSELVTDLEELEKEKATRQLSDALVAELQAQINESNERFSQLTAEYDNLHAAYEAAQSEKSDVEQRRWDLETQHQHQVAELERQIQSLTSQLDAARQVEHKPEVPVESPAPAETQDSHQHAAVGQHKRRVAEQNETIAQLNQHIRKLEEEVSLLSLTCGGSAKPGAAAAGSLRDLQQQIFEKSEELVRQGEKNVALAEKFETMKAQWQELRSEVKDVRLVLLRGVAGSGVDDSLYQHVRLEELVRLRLKALEHEWLLTGVVDRGATGDELSSACAKGDGDRDANDATAAGAADKASVHLANVGAFSALDGLGSIGRLERELRLCRSRNKRLQEQIEVLERELQTAVSGLGEFQALKERAVEIVSRERVEKELRQKVEANYKESSEKIVALSEHIEKLMVHLKHEAAAKTKAIDAQRRVEKELGECREKVVVLQKKHALKDAQLQELEHGAKILEDQLRLMDEKFIDVRNKLDWTRATSQKEVKKLNSELSALRMKWQMASDAGVLASLPDWASVAKLSKKSKPLGSSTSDSRLPSAMAAASGISSSSSNNSNNNSSSGGTMSPSASGNGIGSVLDDAFGKRARFEIPKLPQPDADVGTPWSDAKLSSLTRQFQDRRRA